MNVQRLTVLSMTLVVSAALVACGNPKPSSGTVVRQGVGVRDFFTVRSSPDGDVIERDMAPTPRPREAITSDDYFGIKLEHIYAGNMLGREVGNIALVAEIGGIIPRGVQCSEVPEEQVGFNVSEYPRSNVASRECRYKTVVQINPVFRDGHATFDSAFITPPFRTGNEPLELSFIMAQLNDYELARKIMTWVQEKSNQLIDNDVIDVAGWQRRLIEIGFTAANYILDYASQPTYVFEMKTAFVPVETVEGAQPQNLLMGGDFVIVGMTDNPAVPNGALQAADELIFSSGRLYWEESREEYRESPYIVYKVVRFSRYPNELPIQLSRINRAVRRGVAPEQVVEEAQGALLDLQDARILNETEGEMLLDLFGWYAEASQMTTRLDDYEYTAADIPLAWADLSAAQAARLLPLRDLSETVDLVSTLDNRIYDNYGQTPGLKQSECITLRSLTQDLADLYSQEIGSATRAFEDLQIRRSQLQRAASPSVSEQEELEVLVQVEPAISAMVDELPQELPEPSCPSLRQAYEAPATE